eukprot:gene42853-48823_t
MRRRGRTVYDACGAAEVVPGWGEETSKLAARAMGTGFLTCTIATAVAHGDPGNAALAAAACVTAFLYAFGYLCGAHINPAITLVAAEGAYTFALVTV